MSGHHDDLNVERRISAQDAGFLPKPFTPRQLLESVAAHLTGHRPRSTP